MIVVDTVIGRYLQLLRRGLITLMVGALLVLSAAPAQAFCGFYVSGADAKLFNNATIVVLMREGTRTVLSMQNNYQGPPENFAMVVPVPQVLKEDNVKTLPRAVFERIDQLAAPRLVEYWEQDPCAVLRVQNKGRGLGRAAPMAMRARAAADSGGVKIEAQFAVGEYKIVILSASNSGGLDSWLKQEGYKIPPNAEPYLRPYVQQGMKFFVAKVDMSKVKMGKNGAELSPLRFHYDDEQFRLPVRLGLINSHGKQDLLVHILARGQRYAVANYENVTIPTNIDVSNATKEAFGPFYAALFDETLAKNKGAVVTEYAWNSGTCDPCPVPALRPGELATLGTDVLPKRAADDTVGGLRRRRGRWGGGFVLTRLHARYDSSALGEDLVFKKAEAIAGGREHPQKDGKPLYGAASSSQNQFQARYAVRHAWAGEVQCDNPRFGHWGGPPAGVSRPQPRAATDLAFAPRGGITLASMVRQAVPEIGVKPSKRKRPAPTAAASGAATTSASSAANGSAAGPAAASPASPAATSSCLCSTVGGMPSRRLSMWMLSMLVGVCCWSRRR